MNTANLVRRTSQFYSLLQKSNSALVANRYSSSSSDSSNSSPSSSSNGGGSNEILVVTENAAKQLRNIASSGEHLRICVDSGGCSGFEYKMTLDNDKVDSQEDEVLRPADGVTIVVDKTSLEFIRGAKLDYVQDLMRAAFRITENPKATNGCSCGASFAPKDIVE